MKHLEIDGVGRVSRIGLGTWQFGSYEWGYGEAYAAALEGYRSGGPDGVAAWLVHCARATEHGATEGLAICESLLRG